MRAENSAIPCRDSCPIQAILYPRAPKISPEGTRAVYVFNRMEEYGRFRNPLNCFGLGSLIVPVVQPSQSYVRNDVT
jgi:hypothetical protein